MMPLKRILMEKRFLALPLLLGLLANIFVYILVVYPLGVKSAGARERADAAAVALKAAFRRTSRRRVESHTRGCRNWRAARASVTRRGRSTPSATPRTTV